MTIAVSLPTIELARELIQEGILTNLNHVCAIARGEAGPEWDMTEQKVLEIEKEHPDLFEALTKSVQTLKKPRNAEGIVADITEQVLHWACEIRADELEAAGLLPKLTHDLFAHSF